MGFHRKKSQSRWDAACIPFCRYHLRFKFPILAWDGEVRKTVSFVWFWFLRPQLITAGQPLILPNCSNQIWFSIFYSNKNYLSAKHKFLKVAWQLHIRNFRKTLQRSGKDHSILLVLPSGVYQYKFIVDGELRYIPDLPCVADEKGCPSNLLDVHVCIHPMSWCFFFWLKDILIHVIINKGTSWIP